MADTTALTQLQKWFAEKADEAEKRAARDLMKAGLLLETEIKSNASGRPGPNVITGDYRGSWITQPIPGSMAVTVSTNRPQGRRLEFGFSGTDSLGRTYNQPPYPHVAPAIKTMEPRILELLEEGMEIVMKKGL